jgi:hypothetical protein
MSIYLEFPAIAEYPLYNYPKNDGVQASQEETLSEKEKEDLRQLKDFIILRTV